jgi:hypothetical protein
MSPGGTSSSALSLPPFGPPPTDCSVVTATVMALTTRVSDLEAKLMMLSWLLTSPIVFPGDLEVTGSLKVDGETLLIGNLQATDGDVLLDNVSMGDFSAGQATLSGALQCTSLHAMLSGVIEGALVVNAATTLQDLSVRTTATIAGLLTAAAGLTVSAGGIEVTGGSTFNNSITIGSGGINVTGTATFNDAVNVSGNVSVNPGSIATVGFVTALGYKSSDTGVPTSTPSVSWGVGATSTVNGNNSGGEIRTVAGTNTAKFGVLLVKFSKPNFFGGTPRVTCVDVTSNPLGVSVVNVDQDGFQVQNQATPADGKPCTFNYTASI